MLDDYDDIGDDIEDYDDLLGDLSDDEAEDVGAFMTMDGYELEGILGDIGASPRKKKLAKAAKRIKIKAKKRGVPSKKLYRKAKQKKARKKARKALGGTRSFGGKNMSCGVQAPCAGLLPKNEPVYDTERVSATQAAGDVTFFAIPEGQSSSVSGSAITKSKYHTNMTAVKMLPVPQRFDVFGISWSMDTATAQALNDIRNKCAIQFFIGNTPYATLRLSLLPFYSSIQGSFDGTTSQTPANLAWCTTAAKEGTFDLRTFDLNSGVLVPQRIALQENFSVILKIDSALNMGASKDISFYLHGIKWTEVRQG